MKQSDLDSQIQQSRRISIVAGLAIFSFLAALGIVSSIRHAFFAFTSDARLLLISIGLIEAIMTIAFGRMAIRFAIHLRHRDAGGQEIQSVETKQEETGEQSTGNDSE